MIKPGRRLRHPDCATCHRPCAGVCRHDAAPHDETGRLRPRNRPACRCVAPSRAPMPNPAPCFAQAVDVAQTAERGKFDLLFLADSAAVSVFGIAEVARPHGQDREVRADDAAVGAGGGDQASRPRRDLHHDLQRALYARAAVRLARPDQRRPRGLEPRHLEQRGRRRSTTAATEHMRHADRYDRAAEFAEVVHGPVGQLGRGRVHPRQGIGRLLRPRRRCMC